MTERLLLVWLTSLCQVGIMFTSTMSYGSNDIYVDQLFQDLQAPINIESCETNNSLADAGKYTVSDFIEGYMKNALNGNPEKRSSFGCQPGVIQRCHISYGGGAKSEQWDRFLLFNFDPEQKKVIENSLRCVDTP